MNQYKPNISYKDNRKRDYIEASLKRLFKSTNSSEKINLLRCLVRFIEYPDLKIKLVSLGQRETDPQVKFFYEHYLEEGNSETENSNSYTKEIAQRNRARQNIDKQLTSISSQRKQNTAESVNTNLAFLKANFQHLN